MNRAAIRTLAGAAMVAAAAMAGWLAAAAPAPSAIAGGLALGAVVAAIARPGVGLAIVAGLALVAPFLIVPVRIGAQPPVLDVVVAASLLGTVYAAWRGGRARAPRWLAAAIAVLLAAMAAATAIAWASHGDFEAVQYALKLMLAVSLSLAALAMMNPDAVRRHGPPLVAAAATLQSAVAIMLHYSGDAGASFLEHLSTAGYPAESIQRFLPDGTTARATGLLVDPNVLGVTLAASLPFVLAWTFPRARPRLAGLLALAAIGAALYVSLSRGGWIAAGVGTLVWIGVARPRTALGLAVLGVIGLVLPIQLGPLDHLRSGLLGRDVSAALRIDEIREAGRVVTRYPWFGVGYGNSPHPDVFVGVSNAFLWVAERAGVIAAAAWLAVLGGSLAAAVRRARVDMMSRTSGAALAAVLTAGAVDQHIVSFPHLVALIALLVAVAVGCSRPRVSTA